MLDLRLQLETPPRAWGRPMTRSGVCAGLRNTPTSVGKTGDGCGFGAVFWKHPHERGEDSAGASLSWTLPETPPRAWGRPAPQRADMDDGGNTPTSVGKTSRAPRKSDDSEKHPHERGEDVFLYAFSPCWRETPPRAWGRRGTIWASGRYGRNTPTSVGKTQTLFDARNLPEKHPHERGEDRFHVMQEFLMKETPPRAWGRLNCLW